MTIPPVGAGWSSLTVAVDVPFVKLPPRTKVGLRLKLWIAGGRIVSVFVCVCPKSSTVIFDVTVVPVRDVRTSNSRKVEPAGIVIVLTAGLANALFDVMLNVRAIGDAVASVTRPLLVAPPVRVCGVSVNEKLTLTAWIVSKAEATAYPGLFVEISAVAPPETGLVTIWKVAVVAPAGTTTTFCNARLSGSPPEIVHAAGLLLINGIRRPV